MMSDNTVQTVLTYEIKITGIVQGVGFRPHIYRCAQWHHVKGYVLNNNEGVIIYAQAEKNIIHAFMNAIKKQAPKLSHIEKISFSVVNNIDEIYSKFSIAISENTVKRALVTPPDAFVCEECLTELFDPNDKRYLYPFINCVHCGPRYSIITDLPYDRPNTTMQSFPMCADCNTEYNNPEDRRFHAQPIACPKCGPFLTLYNKKNEIIVCDNILLKIVNLLKEGNILAIKGIGGYHLMADPHHASVLKKLRMHKKREQKPFALLFETVEKCFFYCDFSKHEETLLTSDERPIVLVKKSKNQNLSDLVAPGNKYFGVMLAYTPLQYLILRDNFTCLVCTSANISDEPMIYEDDIGKLTMVADYVVTHNRRIHTFVDDSVVRSINGSSGKEVQIIRRARGYAPKTLICQNSELQLLSIGSELKNTVCIAKNETILLSQYIGDLKNLSTHQSFLNVISHVKKIFDFEPQIIACDMHPNFLNTTYASKLGIPMVSVQHHYAHLCACMLENNFHGDAIGVIFDGMGYGTDGNIWGGEFLVGNYRDFYRAGHFEYFPLPGGDICRKKISIPAFACLLKIFGNTEEVVKHWKCRLTNEEMSLYQKMINAEINSPLTSSVGRIFDVISGLLDLCFDVAYEGQAAILLEQSLDTTQYDLNNAYAFSIYNEDKKYLISLDNTYLAVLKDKNADVPVETIAWKFHNTMIKIIYEVCALISDMTKIKTVVLAGGCFQNKFLLEACIDVLRDKGFNVLYHNIFPTNDGSIALGQAAHVIYS